MDRGFLIAQLELHEDRRKKAYTDEYGNVTVGVGRNLTGKGLSDAEIDFLLSNDIDEVLADLETFPWWASLDPVRQMVVADMRFNLGPTRFRFFKRMLTALGEGDYQKAAASMRQSKWYQQVRSRGVRLVKMMQRGMAEEGVGQ